MNSIKLIFVFFVGLVLLFGCTGSQPSQDKEGEWGAKPENQNGDWKSKPETGNGKQGTGNQNTQPQPSPQPKEEFQLPSIEQFASKPVADPPIVGENKSVKLGNLEISYYSAAASYAIFSLGADLLIHIKNTGSKTETLYLTPIKELQTNYVPKWVMHFFAFQGNAVTLEPGEEKILHYFASNDANGEYAVDFGFWQAPDKSDKVTASVKFYSGSDKDGRLDKTAIVYGYVRDKSTNKSISNAEIRLLEFNGREAHFGKTDEFGRYAIAVPGVDDIKAFFGDQEIAYRSLDYFTDIGVDGYEYYYTSGIAPKRGEKLRLDIYLEPKAESTPYKLKWEKSVSEPYGFFWVLADDKLKYLVASQAKHPPQLDKPTHFYLFNPETGQQLWSYPTENECWGIDISKNGKLVAAGCHDGYTYVVNTADGSLKWKFNNIGMNRKVGFSYNGKYLLTGPAEKDGTKYDVALFDTSDGHIINGQGWQDLWLRNSKFTADDSKYVIGLSEGYMAMFSTLGGNKLWENYIGEFPLFLAIDSNQNTYAAGKGRTLFSFDESGDVRWSYRVPDHTVTAGAITPDGSRVVVGTVGAWVHYIDGSTGQVLWRARIDGEAVGHNAVSISADGKIIAVGSGPENHLTIFNENGTKIFEHEAELSTDPMMNDKWATIGAGASESSQKGIMSTYTSADGSIVVAAYGDSYIREFVR